MDFKGNISMKERAAWIAAQNVGQMATQGLLNTEKKLDKMIAKLDNLGEDDFATIRANRLQALKDKQAMMTTWKQQGHGAYQEIGDQPQWFSESKTNERMICHFYRASTSRCEIVDKHLQILAPKHMETRIIKIDAEKCPFLCERLNIVLMPTIIISKSNLVVDRIEGFDELGGVDNFTTETLEKRLAFHQAIDVDIDREDLAIRGKQFSMGGAKGSTKNNITASKTHFYESDDDFSD